MARLAVVRASVLPVFSDLHLRPDSAKVALPIVARMREEALALGVTEVAFTGDFYHVRGLVPVVLQNALVDELDNWAAAHLTLTVIPGNHDQVDVVGRHALEVFRTHPAVRLYSRPTRDAWGLWIPYTRDFERVRALVKAERGPVLWHGPMLNAMMNDRQASKEGLLAEDFAHCAVAVLGHFHKRQSFQNVHYVGSPWQTRSDEAGQPKGYALLDPAKGELRYVDRNWGPRYASVECATPEEALAELGAYGPDDVVRVAVPEKFVEELSKQLSQRFADFSVRPVRAEAQLRAPATKQAVTIRDYAQAYAEKHTDSPERAAEAMGAFDALAGGAL